MPVDRIAFCLDVPAEDQSCTLNVWQPILSALSETAEVATYLPQPERWLPGQESEQVVFGSIDRRVRPLGELKHDRGDKDAVVYLPWDEKSLAAGIEVVQNGAGLLLLQERVLTPACMGMLAGATTVPCVVPHEAASVALCAVGFGGPIETIYPHAVHHLAGAPGVAGDRAGAHINAKDSSHRTQVIGTFGELSSQRRIDACLHIFRALVSHIPELRFIIAGAHLDPTVERLIVELGLSNCVTVAPDPYAGLPYLGQVDLVLQLGWPDAPDLAFMAVQALAAGCPLIVSDVDAVAMIPHDCCAKVPANASEGDTIIALAEYLLADRPARNTFGHNGARFVDTFCRPEQAAQRYRSVIGSTALARLRQPLTSPWLYNGPIRNLVRDTGYALRAVGVPEASDSLLCPISNSIRSIVCDKGP